MPTSRAGAAPLFKSPWDSSIAKRPARDRRPKAGICAKGLNARAEALLLCHNLSFDFSLRFQSGSCIERCGGRQRFEGARHRLNHIGNGCSGIRKTPARGG
jgi:hypothetical protein